MSLFRYKGSKIWTMDFLFHGQRIRESTGTRSKTLALKIEAKRRRDSRKARRESRRLWRHAWCLLRPVNGWR